MITNNIFYKLTWVILIYFLILSLYNLFYAEENILKYLSTNKKIKQQLEVNQQQAKLNKSLYSELDNLKHGSFVIEERARNDLGLIKEGEIYYQIVG